MGSQDTALKSLNERTHKIQQQAGGELAFDPSIPPPRSRAPVASYTSEVTRGKSTLPLHPEVHGDIAAKARAAVREKDKGNECMRSSDLDEAVSYYTRSIK